MGDEETTVEQVEASEVAGVDLERVRELILAAHPDVVPEMVAGESFEALMASIEPARAAYARIVEQARQRPVTVPAGQPGRQTSAAHMEGLSPSAKIAEGLRRRR